MVLHGFQNDNSSGDGGEEDSPIDFVVKSSAFWTKLGIRINSVFLVLFLLVED